MKPNGSSFDYEPPTVDTTTTEAVTTSNNNECMDVNASAKYRAIANPTTGSMMRVQFGTSVAAADYWEYIAPGQTWVATTPYGVWLGKISCQWLAATGDAAVITQLTGP